MIDLQSQIQNLSPTITNNQGKETKLGNNGKYYCGKQVEDDCGCCTQQCGPNNGCNCCACMWSDIKERGLTKGFFVNNAGFTAELKPDWTFYCGRTVSNPAAGWDGNCGPNNGPNCGSCLILQNQLFNRYKSITEEYGL